MPVARLEKEQGARLARKPVIVPWEPFIGPMSHEVSADVASFSTSLSIWFTHTGFDLKPSKWSSQTTGPFTFVFKVGIVEQDATRYHFKLF